MKNFNYQKQCNATTLDAELKTAGFNLIGVSCSIDWTIVHLQNTETKDPTPIVQAHIYTPPPDPNLPNPDAIRAAELLATSPDVITQPHIWELLRIIGRRLGYIK